MKAERGAGRREGGRGEGRRRRRQHGMVVVESKEYFKLRLIPNLMWSVRMRPRSLRWLEDFASARGRCVGAGQNTSHLLVTDVRQIEISKDL